MKMLQKILATLSLTLGISLALLVSIYLFDPKSSDEDKEGALAALVLFSLPPIALGGALVWNLKRQHRLAQQHQSAQYEQTFLRLLQAQQGEISSIQFATETQLSLEEAKAYLDAKAVLLNADFEVKDSGGIVYRFTV